MDDNVYKLLLIVHLLTVVIGIGAVMLNGVYAAQAKKLAASGGNAVMRANLEVTKIAEYFIYAIPVTGVLMVIKSNQWDFGQTWVWLAIILYVIALGVAHSTLLPGTKRMIELTAGGPPGPEAEGLEKKLAIAGTVNDLIVVALIVLMVWKPGS